MAAELSAPLKLLMLTCGGFVSFGSATSWTGAWVLQPFLLKAQNCAGNSSRCATNYLGMTKFEFGLYVALPSLVSIGGLVVNGLLIDIFGLPLAAILMAFLACLGSAIRAVGAHLVAHHSSMFLVLTAGEVILQLANYSLMACRDLIATRFFNSSEHPFVMGVVTGLSQTGNIIAAFVMPSLAEELSLAAAFWIFTAISGVSIIVAVVLCLLFCCSAQVQAIDEEVRKCNHFFEM